MNFMSQRRAPLGAAALAVAMVVCPCLHAPSAPDAAFPDAFLSPAALAATRDGKVLYIACATAARILVVDLAERKVTRSLPVLPSPTGLCLSADDATLVVTCAAAHSKVCILETGTGNTVATLTAGHTAMSPLLSSDGETLYTCNRFSSDLSEFDLAGRREVRRLRALREPVAAALTPDGKFLLVANHLHHGRADADVVAAAISVIDTVTGRTRKTLPLPNGSGMLRDIRVSPDGKVAVVTHLLSRFHLPTTQLERGWMNTNAKTLIDLATLEPINTVLLDSVDSGAANPWGAAWTSDSRHVVIAHAGTHEISIVDIPKLRAKLGTLPEAVDESKPYDYTVASRIQADVPNDLSFLVGIRRRVRLPAGDRGPRALVVVGSTVYAANYFSDTLTAFDVAADPVKPVSIPLGPGREPTSVRRGEDLFNDAGICFQEWQSCASCHSEDARVDGLNWDLLNDGMGNPKNSKTLLLSFETPPSMSTGVRDSAATANRSGIKHILFTIQPDHVARAIDDFVRSLRPIPSPHLEQGRPSASARRGQELFADETIGCARCHPIGLFTDLNLYDVGTSNAYDRGVRAFDTPSLVELWRTAPYLHDGSAATVRDVLTVCNAGDRHGKTSHLSGSQLDDLVAYLLSL
ncbi:MAG: c-type cytochrome [Verrucomicrobia bacterium]|nr:c-type cytochrome [Verrucomicrobiota bacterium]